MIFVFVFVINENENYEVLLECVVILNGKLICYNVVYLEVGYLNKVL